MSMLILDDEDWIYPTRKPTEKEERLIMGRVAEIGTRVLFDNFVYRFGGRPTINNRVDQ